MLWNLGFPANSPVIFIGLLHLKKRSSKKRTERKKVYAYSNTDLGKVLFHNEMLCNRENRDLLSKIYHFSSVEFLKICALPSVHL